MGHSRDSARAAGVRTSPTVAPAKGFDGPQEALPDGALGAPVAAIARLDRTLGARLIAQLQAAGGNGAVAMLEALAERQSGAAD
jgi:hypothetical protein